MQAVTLISGILFLERLQCHMQSRGQGRRYGVVNSEGDGDTRYLGASERVYGGCDLFVARPLASRPPDSVLQGLALGGGYEWRFAPRPE